uniref:Uncharacterized protein n=1 Tax=Glossina brevipalpis TaxID=37001 RepID=A0A1A9WXF9_9MUSC
MRWLPAGDDGVLCVCVAVVMLLWLMPQRYVVAVVSADDGGNNLVVCFLKESYYFPSASAYLHNEFFLHLHTQDADFVFRSPFRHNLYVYTCFTQAKSAEHCYYSCAI